MVLRFYLCPCSFWARENCICEWQDRRLEGGLWPDLRAFERNLVFQLNYIMYCIIFDNTCQVLRRMPGTVCTLSKCGLFLLRWNLWEVNQSFKEGKDEIRVDEIRDHYCSIILNLMSVLRMHWSKEILSTGQCIEVIQVSEDEGQEWVLVHCVPPESSEVAACSKYPIHSHWMNKWVSMRGGSRSEKHLAAERAGMGSVGCKWWGKGKFFKDDSRKLGLGEQCCRKGEEQRRWGRQGSCEWGFLSM